MPRPVNGLANEVPDCRYQFYNQQGEPENLGSKAREFGCFPHFTSPVSAGNLRPREHGAVNRDNHSPMYLTIRRVIRSQVMSRSVTPRSRPEVAGYRQRLEADRSGGTCQEDYL